MSKIIVVTGQTATGKTEFAQKLAEQYDGELINCDSRQIYRGLDIVTGKDLTDTKFHLKETKGNFNIGYYLLDGKTKIWLYDIVNPDQTFSAADYSLCALSVIKDIIKRGKTPILVGGTYLYIYYLLYQVKETHFDPDWKLRKNLESKTIKELQSILIQKNNKFFESLNRSEKSNPHRLIRKIELLSAGITPANVLNIPDSYSLSEKLQLKTIEIDFYGFYYLEKSNLEKTIKSRIIKRWKQGAILELKKILSENFTMDDSGLRSIGYKQIYDYIFAGISYEQILQVWLTKELQYAKRQYTFMKRDSHIKWKAVDSKNILLDF